MQKMLQFTSIYHVLEQLHSKSTNARIVGKARFDWRFASWATAFACVPFGFAKLALTSKGLLLWGRTSLKILVTMETLVWSPKGCEGFLCGGLATRVHAVSDSSHTLLVQATIAVRQQCSRISFGHDQETVDFTMEANDFARNQAIKCGAFFYCCTDLQFVS